MRSPSRSMLGLAVGAIAALVACGRSTPAPGAGGGIVETGGTSGATSPMGGTSTGGARDTGGAWTSGGAMSGGGASGTGGRLGTGGLGKGGMSGVAGGIDASETTSTGGTILGTGGTTVTGSTVVASTGGTTAAGGTRGSDGDALATVDGAGTSGSIDAGSVAFPPKFFGNIDTSSEVRSDFATYWDQFTPENAGKWLSVQPSAGTFNWTKLDAMYKYCDDNNIVFKEHSFLWGASSQPSWINNSNAVELLRSWMKTFCDRYPKTRIIDVVNEPLHGAPYYREGLGGAGASGWDWIANTFKWAHEACPNAVLVLNDYNIIEYSSEQKRIIELVKGILAAGAPIMAIGAQAHDVSKVPLSTVQRYLADIINQTGLPVYITEMDLGIADDVQQAAVMKDLVTTLWNDPNVPGITYWGYIVGTTWRSDTGLMTDTGTMRPAMTWLMDFLHR